jgi:hypothetical protein
MMARPGWCHAREAYVVGPDRASITRRMKCLGITIVYGVFPNAGGVDEAFRVQSD